MSLSLAEISAELLRVNVRPTSRWGGPNFATDYDSNPLVLDFNSPSDYPAGTFPYTDGYVYHPPGTDWNAEKALLPGTLSFFPFPVDGEGNPTIQPSLNWSTLAGKRVVYAFIPPGCAIFATISGDRDVIFKLPMDGSLPTQGIKIIGGRKLGVCGGALQGTQRAIDPDPRGLFRAAQQVVDCDVRHVDFNANNQYGLDILEIGNTSQARPRWTVEWCHFRGIDSKVDHAEDPAVGFSGTDLITVSQITGTTSRTAKVTLKIGSGHGYKVGENIIIDVTGATAVNGVTATEISTPENTGFPVDKPAQRWPRAGRRIITEVTADSITFNVATAAAPTASTATGGGTGTFYYRYANHLHADGTQLYGGIGDLRMDRNTFETQYQGLFPDQQADSGNQYLSNMNIRCVDALLAEGVSCFIRTGDTPRHSLTFLDNIWCKGGRKPFGADPDSWGKFDVSPASHIAPASVVTTETSNDRSYHVASFPNSRASLGVVVNEFVTGKGVIPVPKVFGRDDPSYFVEKDLYLVYDPEGEPALFGEVKEGPPPLCDFARLGIDCGPSFVSRTYDVPPVGSVVAPGAVQSLSSIGVTATTMSYSFSPPVTGSSPVAYLVEYKRTVDVASAYAAVSSSLALSGTIKNLTPGTSYDIRVTASNRAGMAQASITGVVTNAS